MDGARAIGLGQFRKSVFLSLIGHLALFGIFGFSFGEKFVGPNRTSVSFYGAVLDAADIVPFSSSAGNIPKKSFDSLCKGEKTVRSAALDFLKPNLRPIMRAEKESFAVLRKQRTVPDDYSKNKPAIMFYPHLPFYFNIYFNDRQSVHIELMFRTYSVGSKAMPDYAPVVRKISSGNLEADLLVLRYIGRYLFIQRPPGCFSGKSAAAGKEAGISGGWQTVKIDFSPK